MRKLSIALALIVFLSTVVAAQPVQQEPGCQNCENITPRASPRYRIAWRTTGTTGALFLRISILKNQFTRVAVVALACRLARDFPQDDVLVQVFDDHDSAKRYREPFEQEKPPGWKKYERSLRATYLHKLATHEHWIWWDVNPEKTRNEKIEICRSTGGPSQ